MATKHPRIQVTEDPELTRALRAAAPHLEPGLSRSRQVRDLAIVGADQLASRTPTESERRALLERLAARFDDHDDDDGGIDWQLLRDGKRDAWPLR